MTKLTTANLTFKVGDIITAYRSGYHKVLEIQPRYLTQEDKEVFDKAYAEYEAGEELSPLVFYATVADRHGKLRKPATRGVAVHSCDAFYCKKVDATMIADLIAEQQKLVEQLKAFVEWVQLQG